MVLLAFAGFGNFNTSNVCTWNGTAMDNVEADNSAQFDDAFVNSEINPDTGTHTLTCGDGGQEDSLAWVSIYDANQTGSEDTDVTDVGAGDTSPSIEISASATSMTFGGFKLDRNASSPVPMTGITGLTPVDATTAAGYGIGVTTFGFTSVESNGVKYFAVVAWEEVSGVAARRVMRVD
jgi:hypothetical protein